jgi:hypothetical protein
LREWGFTKKLKKTDWPSIDHHLSKRKRHGRESEVLLHDIVIPAKKVRKETLRNREVLAADYGGEGKPSSIDPTWDRRLTVHQHRAQDCRTEWSFEHLPPVRLFASRS